MPAMDYRKVAALYDAYVQSTVDFAFFKYETGYVCGKVLELMCGTGRLSIPLVESGVDLTCVDGSLEMLAILNEKVKTKRLRCRVIQMDVCELELNERFSMIIIPFNSFAEIVEVERQKKALMKIHDHLAEDGTFICTLHNPVKRLLHADGTMRLLGSFPLADKGKRLFLFNTENHDASRSVVHGFQFYELYDNSDLLNSKLSVEIRFFIHQKETFEMLIRDTGFKVQSIYGGYDWDFFDEKESPYMIWKLSK